MTVYAPDSVRRRIKSEAAAEGKSLSEFVVEAMTRELDGQAFTPPLCAKCVRTVLHHRAGQVFDLPDSVTPAQGRMPLGNVMSVLRAMASGERPVTPLWTGTNCFRAPLRTIALHGGETTCGEQWHLLDEWEAGR